MHRLAPAAVVASALVLGLVAIDATPRGTTQATQTAVGQPRFVNARVETRDAGGSLRKTFDAAVQAAASPAWIGYTVPAVPGDHHMCESDQHPARSYLEGRPRRHEVRNDRTTVEDNGDLAVLFRAEGGKTQKVRLFSLDCELEAGGLPVVWLTNVAPADSVALLRTMVSDATSEVRLEQPVMAIALHRDASAQKALEAFLAPEQPQSLRKRAAFWMGAARGDEGFDTLRRLISATTDEGFRRELVFPLSLSRRAETVDVLIRLAREDASAGVRRQAMFWLGQKAGRRTAAALADGVASDPDTQVKRQAVFALSRMPDGEGVPRLIEVARNNANAEVRRQAMFWLGQSDDPRALAFLEEVLRK